MTFIRNFTDIDDKIINKANKENVPWKDVVETYIKAYHDDMDAIGVQRATHEPRATEHIEDMLRLIETLIAKGHAYATGDGDVYFRVRSFKDYGKLFRPQRGRKRIRRARRPRGDEGRPSRLRALERR